MGKQGTLFGNCDPPANAQLSAFIKSVRLRRTEDAALWLMSLWRIGPQHRERVQRRILISAAEDCLSVPIMQHVSQWFNSPSRFDLKAAIREVLRITRTPNWYATEGGRRYIRQWLEAEIRKNPYLKKRSDCLLRIVETTVRERDLLSAMQAFNAYYQHEDSNRWQLAQLLTRLALETDNRPALALAELFEENVRHLWHDGNYSGHTLYSLIAGPVGEPLDPPVTEEEVLMIIAITSPLLSSEVIVPSWAMDGIHVAGNDPRFSGSLRHMAAACDVFEKLGRLDVNDDWAGLLDEAGER